MLENKEEKETGIPWLSGTASLIPSVHDAERIVLGETECRRCRRVQLPAHVRRPENLSVPPELFDDWQRPRYVERKPAKFTTKQGKKRKPGTGCISQVSKNTWQGKFTPWNPEGTRQCHVVYAKSYEECERKLEEMIEKIMTNTI